MNKNIVVIPAKPKNKPIFITTSFTAENEQKNSRSSDIHRFGYVYRDPIFKFFYFR